MKVRILLAVVHRRPWTFPRPILNVPKIKGVHQAMKCGILAADHLAETGAPAGFDAKLRHSEVVKELHKVRNIRPGFYKGFWRGFIRAEVIHWDELLEIGSWAKARETGKLRIEGKEYEVKDGDVINFRFAV